MNLTQYGTATAIDACGAVVTELDPNNSTELVQSVADT